MGDDAEQAARKVQKNDRQNGLRVRRHCVPNIDIVFRDGKGEKASVDSLDVRDSDAEQEDDQVSENDEKMQSLSLK